MIRIEKRRLKFLLAGRVLAVELPREPARPYSRTRTYAVALPGKKSATCRVQVLETNGLQIRIRHAPGAEDKPRMLARGFGYTELGDPLDAGECLPVGVTAGIAEESRARFAKTRADEQQRLRLRSLAIRLRAASKSNDLAAVAEIRRELEGFV